LFTWLSYRCYVAKGEERIPIFGEFGLANQLGAQCTAARAVSENNPING
jgi:hypothetical protein